MISFSENLNFKLVEGNRQFKKHAANFLQLF